MTADWSRLTTRLAQAQDTVFLTWAEFDAIVGGVPRSAIDHYPQWWHGDRANTRAWRAAGYEPTQVRPGISVLFERQAGPGHRGARALVGGTGTRPTTPNDPPPTQPMAAATSMPNLDPARCLFVVPCSARKRSGGQATGPHPTDRADLSAARHLILAASHADESRLLPAWRRYDGSLYRAAAPILEGIAQEGRLMILSGGYGVLDGLDMIGTYDRLMHLGDWPKSVLEHAIGQRVGGQGLDVVAFAGATTPYARLLRRVDWRLPPGRSAHLIAVRGMRGVSAVSTALGTALVAFATGRGNYPPQLSVERLDR